MEAAALRGRLQKIISEAGIMSRRAAERCIEEGRVTVNGAAASIGMSADPDEDDIRLDGRPVVPAGQKIYIMLNKPRGYITAVSDDRGRKTVTELVRDAGGRLYPVGRLDLRSEGLLIMTNDGMAAQKLMSPAHGIPKTYRVGVAGDVDAALPVLRGEIDIDGRPVRAVGVRLIPARDGPGALEITIGEGRKRQIRRMCEAAGLSVTRLVRTAEGELRLGGLPSGKWRHLTPEELKYLLSIR